MFYNNPYQYYAPPNFSQGNQLNMPQFIQNNQIKSLQGRQVDNVDVVKATEIPLDGSISYFPLIDGTAIFTKQLMQDGTSRINIYKPVQMEEKEEDKFVTQSEFEKQIEALKQEFGKEKSNESDTNN